MLVRVGPTYSRDLWAMWGLYSVFALEERSTELLTIMRTQ
jgi:hypothetical protein